MDKLNMKTSDASVSNVAKIAALWPQCVTERLGKDGKSELAIDFDKLRAELSSEVLDEGEERYQFTWPDKRAASRLANTPSEMTLRPCTEESVGKDGTPGGFDSENLYIEGDNLEVLKLLREDYLGKVKMIYIDPPYNTGNDFVYNDDFTISGGEFEERGAVRDENGNLVVDPMQRNTESNGRFHTDWLNMIYPRLKVARDLLSDDGVIFISIDDNEVENMKKIGNEIFGANNFVGIFVIKSNPRGSMSSAEIANLHEYMLLYTKCRDCAKIIGHELSEGMLNEYALEDEKGKYRLLGLRMRGGFWRRVDRPKLYFPIFVNPLNKGISLTENEEYNIPIYPVQPSTGEDGTWRWSKEKINQNIDDLCAKLVTRDGRPVWDIFQKDYFDREGGRRTKAKSIWDDAEVNYQNGTIEIRELLGNSSYFDYSKPPFLIKHSIDMIEFLKNDIVLDFFSGSATTAHAVMQLNAEDFGKRRFIMVQLPELTEETSEAYKAGYKNICEIGKERIRRVGRKVKEDAGLQGQDLDIGFRVLKLDSSNMEDVFYTPDEFEAKNLFTMVDNIKEGRTPEDLLFQIMPELNIPLSAKIETKDINGKKVFVVDDGYLVATFDKDVNTDTLKILAQMKPQYFVMRDASVSGDNVLDDFDQIFRYYSPDTIRKIL